MACSLLLMQEALHLVAQSPHPLHFAVSIRILNNEKRLNNPNTVPTGQTVLHHVRPCFHAITKITARVITAMRREEMLKTEGST